MPTALACGKRFVLTAPFTPTALFHFILTDEKVYLGQHLNLDLSLLCVTHPERGEPQLWDL